MEKELEEFKNIKGSNLFVFNIWTKLISKYQGFYRVDRIKDKVGLLLRDIYTISVFSKNIVDTNSVFGSVAFWMFKYSRILPKVLENFEFNYTTNFYYTPTSFMIDSLIESIYEKLQKIINNLGKNEFVRFMRASLDSELLVDLATKDTDVDLDRTFIFRFVNSYTSYLEVALDNQRSTIFKGVDTLNLTAVLSRVKEEQLGQWMIDAMEVPENLDLNLVDFIIAVYYWMDLNTTVKDGSSIEKIYNDPASEVATVKTMMNEFLKLDDKNKINFLWYLVGDTTFKKEFLYLAYAFGFYIDHNFDISEEDKRLVREFILENHTVLEAKNDFIERQIYFSLKDELDDNDK